MADLRQPGARERQAVWMIPAPTFMLRASWQSKPHSSTPWMSNRCCSVPPSTRHGESNVAHGVLFKHEKVTKHPSWKGTLSAKTGSQKSGAHLVPCDRSALSHSP